ncbi:MAG: topoisomerase protein [candidate division TM6 bacterium GW2011_GWF2_28_16]|nr:MAG: topoisomerase protein [candidate division TM6 bacterium GW2011_GWF2_28_16]
MDKKKKSTKKNMIQDAKLLIVESPAKIKTISKFLGPDFKIMSTFGHIKDLPPKKLGIIRDEKTKAIDLEYVPMKDKDKTIADICKQASKSGEIYLASDPDREGEIISWHIGQEIAKTFKDKSKIYRITFNEITKQAILDAINDKSTINMKMVRAQQARRILDRWVGYQVSPILWKKISKGLSAGRVQSVALLLICNREEEILNFKPEEFWSILGKFNIDKSFIDAELFKINKKEFKITNKEEADKILAAIKKENYSIEKITDSKKSRNPLAPFMTSTLQQDAYNKLGFSVDKTMFVAQKLYEGVPLADKDKPEALITYMRTDSLRLSDTALDASRNYISKNFGADYLPKAANVYSKKGAQDAHEAIRPINFNVTPEIAAKYLPKDHAKLYTLIWQRSIACQMNPAQYFQRQVLISGGNFTFKAIGSTLIFDGFLRIYPSKSDEQELIIPKDIKEKDLLNLKNIEGKQHFTKPAPRYNESSLVKEMEKQGIGRPSTYATIISTIQKRKYVDKDQKKFVPTELGKAVIKMLVEHLPDIINVTFTAKMEQDLDKIAEGEIKRDEVLNDFYEPFEKDLKTWAGKDTKREAIKTNIKCPKCKSELVVRFGKAGEFLGCSKFPTCDFTSQFKKDEQGNIELVKAQEQPKSDIKCPNCGKNLVQKIGRFGPFYACPGYPECKYIHTDSLKMPCPMCKGKIVKRASKRGVFWGCSNYPKCKFIISGDVQEEKCPKCKSPYLLKRKDKDDNVTLSCPNKDCGFTKKSE